MELELDNKISFRAMHFAPLHTDKLKTYYNPKYSIIATKQIAKEALAVNKIYFGIVKRCLSWIKS